MDPAAPIMRGSVAGFECCFADHAVTLSPGQLAALAAYARVGDQRQAADSLGVTLRTFKERLTNAYCVLGVQSNIDAFRALGWLRVPEAA